MKNKVLGLILCAVLAGAAIGASWLFHFGGFYHQHREEKEIRIISVADRHSEDTSVRKTDANDRLLRNYLFCNLSGEIMGCAPSVWYAEDEKGDLFQLSSLSGNTLNNPEYVIRLAPVSDRSGEVIWPLSKYRHLIKHDREMRLVFPNEIDDAKAVKIKDEVSYFEKTLYSYDFRSFSYGYDNFIDTASFVDYFLLTELSGPEYPGKKDYIFYKNQRGKYCLCVSDFLDAAQLRDPSFTMNGGLWYAMLLRDSGFVEKVIGEYETLRQSFFSEKYLFEYLDETAEFLSTYYGCSDEQLKNEVRILKDYLHERISWMDENIHSLRQYCAKSNIKNYTDEAY